MNSFEIKIITFYNNSFKTYDSNVGKMHITKMIMRRKRTQSEMVIKVASLVLMTSYGSTKTLSWDYVLRYKGKGGNTNLFDGGGNFPPKLLK